MGKGVKLGRLTNSECSYIRDNRALKTAEEMARELFRSPKMVENELARVSGEKKSPPKPIPPTRPAQANSSPAVQEPKANFGASASEIAVAKLKAGVGWALLKREFETSELQVFAERYAALTDQFEGDSILATEESQILKVIRCEILMGRLLSRQRSVAREIGRTESEVRRLRAAVSQLRLARQAFDAEQAELEVAEMAQQAAANSHRQLTAEYATYDMSHQKLTEALKGTRKQRIDNIKSSKKSFLDVIKELQQQDIADMAGRQNEQMKRAASKELERLGRETRFADGEEDRPILSADTVGIPD